MQALRPHLLQAGDTVLLGSIVLDSTVVGVSGAIPWFDEAIAGTVAMWLRALGKAAVVDARRESLFLPKDKA